MKGTHHCTCSEYPCTRGGCGCQTKTGPHHVGWGPHDEYGSKEAIENR